jgi:hypothetical protein
VASPESRDAGLRRVARGTRWLAAGSIVAAGAFSFFASRSHPGTGAPARAERAGSSATGGVVTSPLAPAPSRPVASSGPPVVVSGGT